MEKTSEAQELPFEAVAVLKAYRPRIKETSKYYAYYDGEEDLGDWASPKFKQKHGWALRAARTNYSPAIVSAYTDEIELDSVELVTAMEALKKEELEDNLKREFARAFDDCWITGDSFLWVDQLENGEFATFFQRADTMIPIADEKDPRVLKAVGKIWHSSGWFMELTYRDEESGAILIDTYGCLAQAAKADGKARFTDNPGKWYLIDSVESAFSMVPCIWIKKDAVSQWGWGRSVLKDILPIQDRYNKFVADAISGAEAQSAPTRYFLDNYEEVAAEGDENGKVKIDFDESKNDILYTSAKSGGQFPGPNMSGLIEIQKQTERNMTSVVGLSPWALGNAPDNISTDTAKIYARREINKRKAFIRDNRAALNGILKLMGLEGRLVFNVDLPDTPDENQAS